MKIFLSWSGEKSLCVAKVFKEWIPCINPKIVPYISAEDIDKGARWSSDIANELNESNFGILCVTKDNVNSPWLNFEAGALSKTIDKAHVCPFLFDLLPSDISNSPILQFQMTNIERDDVFKLFHSINASMEKDKLDDAQLQKMFDLTWPNIDKGLKEIEKSNKGETKKSDSNAQQHILEEMLDLLRTQQLLLKNPEQIVPVEYLTKALTCARKVDDSELKVRVPQQLLEEYREAEKSLYELLNNRRDIWEERGIDDDISILRVKIDNYIRVTKIILRVAGIVYPKIRLRKNPYIDGDI